MTDTPRIPPLPPSQWPAELHGVRDIVPAGTDTPLGDFNIFGAFAHHPALFQKWMPLGGYLLGGGTLPPRDRELLILRTAVRCGSSYEWGQHVDIALRIGLSREEVDRVVAGPGAEGWSAHDATLLRAADELHDTSTISDGTWDTLSAAYDRRQLIEVAALVGQYHLVAFALNALRVPLDEGLEPLPGA